MIMHHAVSGLQVAGRQAGRGSICADLTCCINRMAGVAASCVLKRRRKLSNAPIQIVHLPAMPRLAADDAEDEMLANKHKFTMYLVLQPVYHVMTTGS